MIWFLLLGMLVVAIPLVIERNRAEMEDADRGSASGQFAELPDGVTHFEWIAEARDRAAFNQTARPDRRTDSSLSNNSKTCWKTKT